MLCAVGAELAYYDAGPVEAGFGAPTITQPGGPNTFPLTMADMGVDVHPTSNQISVSINGTSGLSLSTSNPPARFARTNLELTHALLRALGKPASLIRFVADRPGHDRRYAIDCTRMEQELAWRRRWTFEKGLAATIAWYQQNTQWLADTRSGSYRDYFDRHYVNRAATFASR